MIYIWQQSQWQQLHSEWCQQRLPHALLLTGSAGLGKLDFAKSFAAKLLCDNSSKRKQYACGSCKSCGLVMAATHPDYYLIAPEKALIKIDQIRELGHNLASTATAGGQQVVIINPAEAMNSAAANALLKTLEEPAGETVLMLISNSIANIPATILSRCQRLNFSNLHQDESLTWLKQQLNTNNPTEATAATLLRLARFSPLKALSLAKSDYLALREELLKYLLYMQQTKFADTDKIGYFAKHDLTIILEIIYGLALDIMRLQAGAGRDYLTHQDRFELLLKLASKVVPAKLAVFAQQITEARAMNAGSFNLNPQLLLESIFLQLLPSVVP